MNNQLPIINIQTVQVALATFITNCITGILSNLAAWAKLPIPVTEKFMQDNSAFFSIMSVSASALLATVLVGWFTRTMATLQAANSTAGVTVTVDDPAAADKLGVAVTQKTGG